MIFAAWILVVVDPVLRRSRHRNAGPLDVLGRLHDGRGYEELLPKSELVGDRRRSVRVVDLPTLIAIKGATGRRRDRIVLPILRALLKRR